MRKTRVVLVLCLLLSLALAGQARASELVGSELTNSGGNLRTGWYPNEGAITPELVTSGTFGRQWTTPVQGQVYAQPLLDDGTLFVATEEDDIYGLNPNTGAVQWSKSVGEPWNAGEIECADLAPHVGVTATPVIDPTTGIAYFTYKAYQEKEKEPEWFMDAVVVATGAQAPGFPVLLSGTAQNAAGQSFHPQTELQRPGLLLLEGVVYAAFGSDCDHPVWQGWVFGVSTTGEVKARWAADETGEGAGIWQSGAGLTSDGPGTILLSTGNGGAPSNPLPGDTPPEDLGESIVRLDVQSDGSLKAVDFFAPYDADFLDTWDADFASGGVTGLPEEYFGTPAIPRLAVAVGKDGYVYLLNREDLGGIAQGPSGSDDVVQRIGPYGGVWSRPGVWPGEGGWVYIPTASGGTSPAGSSGNLRVYQYGVSGTGMPTLSLQATSAEAFGFSSSASRLRPDPRERRTGDALERTDRYLGEVRVAGGRRGQALRRHPRRTCDRLWLTHYPDPERVDDRIPNHHHRRIQLQDIDAHRHRAADSVEPQLQLIPVRAWHTILPAARAAHHRPEDRNPNHVLAKWRRPNRGNVHGDHEYRGESHLWTLWHRPDSNCQARSHTTARDVRWHDRRRTRVRRCNVPQRRRRTAHDRRRAPAVRAVQRQRCANAWRNNRTGALGNDHHHLRTNSRRDLQQ